VPRSNIAGLLNRKTTQYTSFQGYCIFKVSDEFYLLLQVETFSGVYKKLTGKDVNFEFPEFQL
jgi:hypothetical protein